MHLLLEQSAFINEQLKNEMTLREWFDKQNKFGGN